VLKALVSAILVVSVAGFAWALEPAHLSQVSPSSADLSSQAQSASAVSDNADDQALEQQYQQLSADKQTLQTELSQYQAQHNADETMISELQAQNQNLTQSMNSLRATMYQLTTHLQAAQTSLAQQASQQSLSREKLPSFKRSLIVQTHRAVICAQDQDCTLRRHLGLKDEDKLQPVEVQQMLNSRYFMPVTLSVLVFVVLLLGLMTLLAWRDRRKQFEKGKTLSASQSDYEAMAGENLADTRLDMARALIEMGEKKAAIEALNEVLACGDESQQAVAQRLLAKVK